MNTTQIFHLFLVIISTLLWLMYNAYMINDHIERSENTEFAGIPSGHELPLLYKLLPMLIMYMIIILLYFS